MQGEQFSRHKDAHASQQPTVAHNFDAKHQPTHTDQPDNNPQASKEINGQHSHSFNDKHICDTKQLTDSKQSTATRNTQQTTHTQTRKHTLADRTNSNQQPTDQQMNNRDENQQPTDQQLNNKQTPSTGRETQPITNITTQQQQQQTAAHKTYTTNHRSKQLDNKRETTHTHPHTHTNSIKQQQHIITTAATDHTQQTSNSKQQKTCNMKQAATETNNRQHTQLPHRSNYTAQTHRAVNQTGKPTNYHPDKGFFCSALWALFTTSSQPHTQHTHTQLSTTNKNLQNQH